MFNQVSKKANSLRSGRSALYATKADANYSLDNQGREKLAKDINDASLGPSKDGKGKDVFSVDTFSVIYQTFQIITHVININFFLVVKILGAIVDVAFPRGREPFLYNAIKLVHPLEENSSYDNTITLEVSAHLGYEKTRFYE